MAKAWYILHTYSGYENKIERTIRALIEKGLISADFVTDIKIPEELVIENKGGKKRNVKRKFLPGYMLVEMNLPDLGWKNVCSEIRKIQGVTGFLGTAGNEKPQPISPDEAKEILQKTGEIKGDKNIRVIQNFSEGQHVKIIEGAFASFTGVIDEVMADKNKLRVMVAIFGRTTPVEVEMSQAEII